MAPPETITDADLAKNQAPSKTDPAQKNPEDPDIDHDSDDDNDVSKMLDSCSTFIRRPAPVVNSANEPDIAAILACDAKKVWRRVWTVLRLT